MPKSKIVWGIISFGCGVFLLALSLLMFPEATKVFVNSISPRLLVWMVPITLLSLGNLMLAAYKWKVTASPLHGEEKAFEIFFNNVLLAAVIGQFVSLQLSMVVVRTVGLQQQGLKYTKSFYTVILDLTHDLIVSLLAVLPASLVILEVVKVHLALFLFALLWLLTYLLIGRCHHYLGRGLSFLYFRIRTRVSRKPPVDEYQLLPQVPTPVARQLLVLATIKFCFVLVRFALVLAAASLPISFLQTAVCYPLIQLTFLVNLTPGGLGLTEWGWVGLLHLQGVEPSVAVTFSLLNRVMAYGAVVIIGMMVLCRFGFRRLSQVAAGKSWKRLQ